MKTTKYFTQVQYDLKKPCANCPFLTCNKPSVGRDEAVALSYQMFRQGKAVCCSEKEGSHCVGALLMAESSKLKPAHNNMLQREYHLPHLDRSLAVYPSVQAFVEAQPKTVEKKKPTNLKTFMGNYNGSEIRAVAAKNTVEAIELLGITTYDFRQYFTHASEFSNYAKVAMTKPGTVFRKAFGGGGWEEVA